MALSPKAHGIYSKINQNDTKLGDLRNIAKEIRKDHDLAMELWSAGGFFPRMLAILIMDKKVVPDAIENIFDDIEKHEFNQRTQLADWLMANQLTKDKKTIALMESWEHHPSAMRRRIFWYYQGRLRWMGQTPPDNTEELMTSIEKKLAAEAPEVQWAMNFAAGWIGVFDKAYREQCIAIGERLGLYKDDFVHKNCTPNYLPKFIEIEAAKRKL